MIVSLSVLRTLRSVLTGSSEPPGRIMVCYMYYTYVFVGINNDNIDKLKSALEAELNGSDLTDLNAELDALAEGLKSFIGYGSNGSLTGKGIGKNGYSSSYDSSNATWENLCKNCQCKSNSSCSKCSCGSSVSSVCSNPSKCCENCDVRKAAKIFLGFLPSLYYALKYLNDRCNGGWNTLKINDHDKPLRHFLRGMGFDLEKLNEKKKGQEIFGLLSSLFTSSNGPLEKLYEKSKKYFTSRSLVPSSDSPSDSKPETVRSILLWLSGLPFIPGFKDLLDHCKGLCSDIKDSKNSVNPENFETSLFNSCFLSPFVLAAIQRPGASNPLFIYDSLINKEKFFYPSDPSKLFEAFCDFVRKIYIPLNFLQYQCGRPSDQAGWKDCAFGQSCAEKFKSSPASSKSLSPSGSSCCKSSAPHGYLCTSSGTSNVHEHCMNGNQCIGLGTCDGKAHSSGNCKPCPHHLMRFLIDGSENSKNLKNLESPFQPPEDFPKMGFKAESLPTPGRNGRDLYDVLNSFCGSKTSPLTKLFDFSLFVAMRPPETLIELIAFFLQFRLNLWKGPLKTEFSQYASMEPGTPDGSALKTAIEKLDDFSGHRGSHSADLQSLYACDGPSNSSPTCGRYLFPLNNINGVFTKEFCAVYLSWVCHLGLKLHAMFQKFHEEAKGNFSCCLESSGKQCEKIVHCPCALPFLYTYGFTFYQPERLNCHGHEKHTGGSPECILKSCKNFLDQLDSVLASGSPLDLLIKQIERFLWSIRLPFFLFVLAFWAFVISYFIYVHLYHLDVLEQNSHDHPAWSFK
ncbi:variant erythrocyte surface antigen-1 family protein, partial [Babesia divergens]